MATKREYVKSLNYEIDELVVQIKILEKFKGFLQDQLDYYNSEKKEVSKRIKDFLEEQLSIYEEEIQKKEDRIAEINIELDDLEDSLWNSTQESQRDYMFDVLSDSDF